MDDPLFSTNFIILFFMVLIISTFSDIFWKLSDLKKFFYTIFTSILLYKIKILPIVDVDVIDVDLVDVFDVKAFNELNWVDANVVVFSVA